MCRTSARNFIFLGLLTLGWGVLREQAGLGEQEASQSLLLAFYVP